MIQEKELIEAGKFLKTHGLKGELNAYTEYDAEILDQGYPVIVDMDGIFVPFYVASIRPKGLHGSLILLDGIDSIDKAKPFVNKTIWILRKDLADFLEVEEDELDEEMEFIGYDLYDQNDNLIGEIVGFDDSTPNWLLLVTPVDGDEEDIIYIPFAEELVIDEKVSENPEEKSYLKIQIPEGLLNINDKDSGIEIIE